MKLTLRKPTLEDKKSYLDYIEAWGNEFIYPTASSARERTFEELIERIELDEKNMIDPVNRVPATTFILIDENQEIYGSINLRYFLNEDLLKYNSHIGYGIKPNKRKQGYGKLMLSLVLEKAREHRLTKVLITCNDENIASYKTIEACGGVLENKVFKTDGYIRRYWITL
ncbi:MAG: GNAT family N-acetyltransferase [Tenericutes bacterium HGW-Tenericutes-2]|jgi:predicted acetyltransferase|nr:MAG: GNAT family N-acetyltransferase [Tenericutes bacterium HGW-Tenericutes-2]